MGKPVSALARNATRGIDLCGLIKLSRMAANGASRPVPGVPARKAVLPSTHRGGGVAPREVIAVIEGSDSPSDCVTMGLQR